MDLQQTVQDLAEAWVAASTDTNFRRTQLHVYGSGSQEETEEGDEHLPSEDVGVDPTAAPPSPPLAAVAGGEGSGGSHSRKRKQSSPQPRREGLDRSAGGATSATTIAPAAAASKSTGKGNPSPVKKAKESEGKMLPVHCVVEILDTHPTSSRKGSGSGVSGGDDSDCEREEEGKKGTESRTKEGYAIVPATLQLRDLVRVALAKLDYPAEKAKNATGVIQVRNWKALPFSAITDNVQSSVGQLFGDLLSHITLKISVLSSNGGKCREWTDQAVRCTVMELLKHYNQSRLAQICPLSQSMISYIANAKYKASISNEKCEEFGRWYKNFTLHKFMKPSESSWPTNIKVKFDPVREIPLLRDWYQDSQHPTDAMFELYRDTLNRLPSRMGPHRRPVEIPHLKTWWKNERAKLRKTGSATPASGGAGVGTVSSTTPPVATMTPASLPGPALVIGEVAFVPPPRGRGKFVPAFYSPEEDELLVVQEQTIAMTTEHEPPVTEGDDGAESNGEEPQGREGEEDELFAPPVKSDSDKT